MTPADRVIDKFGGRAALAKLIGKGVSTIQYWAKVGSIPTKWQEPLLRLARERSIDLSPSDFIETTPEATGRHVVRLPEAKWPGVLAIGDSELDVYVLEDGQRVISRTGAVAALIGPQGGGNLQSYLRVQNVSPYVPANLDERMIAFRIPGVVNKNVYGMTAEAFLDICRGYVRARDADALQTPRQIEIAIQAGSFLSACANVGLIALIDEVTGYQYDRRADELQIKLKLYLEDEMRKWEKTFPDELWREFGRLTHWRGPLHQRPRFWGKLVMELIYEYLDSDVTDWLRKNAPAPQRGQNYHQWLTSQYGLRKLIEHIWMVIGMASACDSLSELKRRMAEKYGRVAVQSVTYLPPPDRTPPTPKRRQVRPQELTDQGVLVPGE